MAQRRLRKRQREALLASLRQGASISAACAAANLPRRTFYAWLQSSPDFEQQVEQAQAEAILTVEACLWQAIGAGDVKAAKWWLERRCPEYRPPARVQIQHAQKIDDYELQFEITPPNPDMPATFDEWVRSIQREDE